MHQMALKRTQNAERETKSPKQAKRTGVLALRLAQKEFLALPVSVILFRVRRSAFGVRQITPADFNTLLLLGVFART